MYCLFLFLIFFFFFNDTATTEIYTLSLHDALPISFAEGREQPGSRGRLCVKGRYGWDYAASPQRLTTPLIRREGSYPKGALSADVRGEMTGDAPQERRRRRKPGGLVDYAEVLPHFREATWDEALDLVARRLTEIGRASCRERV